MASTYHPFIDWMKCLGMTLIVVGHVAATPINGLTPPIYPKQLGVALFMFAMGFSLARESRPWGRVLYNRLFEMYLFGLACAVIMSAIGLVSGGDLIESNYLPFLGGANVLIDSFPTNQTTWYIGTYLHVLVLWAMVLRKLRVTPRILALAIGVEVVVRAGLIPAAGGYVAYMLAPNWSGALLLGMLYGQQPARAVPTGVRGALGPLAVLLLLSVAWPALVDRLVAERSFPFMRLDVGSPAFGLIAASVCASFLYVAFPFLIFHVTRTAAVPSWVRFIARNTVVVFIGHMPLFDALDPWLSQQTASYGLRAGVRILVCLVALAAFSEVLRRVTDRLSLRERLAVWVGLPMPVPAVSRAAR